MIKKSLFIAIILILNISLSVLAGSSFPINGGSIPPNGSLELSTAKMRSKATYTINCKALNLSSIDIPFNINITHSGNSLLCTIDSGSIHYNGQCVLPPGEHSLNMQGIVKYEGLPSRLLIQNLDFDYSISVKDCMATPLTTL